MAFDDSNDIKIKVTLDAQEAVEGAKAIKTQIEEIFDAGSKTFKELANVTKQFAEIEKTRLRETSKVAREQIEAEASVLKAKEKTKQALIQENTKRKIAASNAELAAEKLNAQQVVALSQITANKEKAALDARIERINKYYDTITERSRQANSLLKEQEKTLRATSVQELKNAAPPRQVVVTHNYNKPGRGSDSEQDESTYGRFRTTLRSFNSELTSMASGWYLVKEAVGIATLPMRLFVETIQSLSEAAGKVEGLSTAFNTLQRSVGANPLQSIQQLRDATQGLISDVDLYQKANQAVLLGVPTETFNQAAAAAVKLGRAMGIDATLGLESLSIGLGRQSRLYLDNLGIVVSATEAYKNFARENGLLASELSDGEKRAAFYAEALRKIRERAEELPDITDSVSIAYQRAAVQVENLTTKFLEGYNQSPLLASALNDVANVIKGIGSSAESAGRFFGELLGFIIKVNVAALNLIPSMGGMLGTLKELGAADFSSTAQALKSINDQIAAQSAIVEGQKQKLQGLKESLSSFREEGSYNKRVQEIAQAEQEVKVATEELDKLKNKLVEVKAQSPITIAPKLDKAQFEQDVSDTSNLVEQILKGTRTDAGDFQIPGLDEGQLAQFGQSIQNISAKLENKNLKSKEANELLESEINKYLELSRIGTVSKLTAEWASVTQEITKSGDATGQLRQKQESLTEQIAIYSANTSAFNRSARGELQGLINFQLKAGKDLAAQQRKGASDVEKANNRLSKQIEDIIKKTNRAAKAAIPQNFSDRLLAIFKTLKPGTKEFNEELEQLSREAEASGVELGLLSDKAKDLAQQLAKGVPAVELEYTVNGDKGKGASALDKLNKKALDLRATLGNIGIDVGKPGGFFGFQTQDIEGMTADEIAKIEEQGAEAAEALAGQISSQLSGAISATIAKDYRAAAQQAGAAVGSVIGGVIGGAIGSAFGATAVGAVIGAQIGAVVGQVVGDVIYTLGGDKGGTQNRKALDKYFGELFDQERLGAIVSKRVVNIMSEGMIASLPIAVEQIKPQLMRFTDFVFEGMTAYGGTVEFGGENFFNYFNTLGGEIQATFKGVGFAIAAALGVGEEEARLLGVAIANNIGGNLQNLQVLVQQTGKSFEELGDAIVNAFLDGQLSIQEAYESLVALQNIAQNGIPGAFGDVKQAAENFQLALAEGKGSRYLLDSFRDIGYETQDLKGSFNDVVNTIGQAAGLTGEQIQLLFQVFKANGINSIEDFTNASNDKLITILANLEKIKNGSRDIFVTPDTSGEGSQDNNDKTDDKPKSSGSNPAANLLKQQREQARELIRTSAEYLAILEQIRKKEISRVEGAEKIKELNDKALKAIKDLAIYTEAYQKLLNKDKKLLTEEDLKNIAKYAADIQKLKKFLEDLGQSGEDVKKSLDLKPILPYIKDLNDLGNVSRQAGVELDKTVDILIKGFLQGRLTIGQVNDQIKKLKDNLGAGIPGKIGAVSDAFQNLIDAGRQGGSFSTEAFTDIFAEFREKFQKEGAALREAQRKVLTANVDAAQKAFNEASDPVAAETARKALEEARKALDEFSTTVPKPDLADLRNELLRTFDPKEVDKFFQALDESGIGGFDELAKAGNESIIAILGRLAELGFKFGRTSDDIKNINKNLRDQEKQANDNKDPLKEALDIIKQFNEGASVLPPTFDATNKAVAKLNGPLEKLAGGFDNLIEKLALLSGKTFENDVVFNVRTVGDDNSKALIDILFGAGETVGKETGSTRKTSSISESGDLIRLTRQLSNLIKRGQGNSSKASDIREQIRRLRTAG